MSHCLMKLNRILYRLLLPIFFITSVALFAQNNQTVLPADWNKLQDLDRIFLESGLAVPFRTRPYSIEELKFYLKRINPSRLSPAGRQSLSRINADLKQRSLYSEEDALAFNTALTLNLESYLHSNSNPELWLYGYEERLPMVSVPLDLWLFNTMYAHLSIDIKEGYRVTQLNPDNYFNVFSLEHNLVEADWNFPFRSFFALGGEHWLFQLGRDQLNWGNGRTGNLMLSDYADYYDGVRFTTFWRRFKFTTAYIVLQPWLKSGENIWGSAIAGDDGFDFVFNDGDLYKAFFGHRFEFNFFDRLNISLAESVTFGNKYPELSDFNPLMLYHNWFISERANSLMTLDFELNPAKRLNIYGQVAVDEFKTSKDAGGVPSAMGYLGGIAGFIPLGSGYLDIGAEAVYTDPWFYHDWYPLLQHTTRRRIHTAYHEYGSGQYDWIDKPLGYFTGPDTILQSYYIGYGVSGRFRSLLELRIIHHGRIRIDGSDASTTFSVDFMDDANWADLKTPTGTPEIKWIIRLHLSIQPTRRLTLSSDLYSIWIKNYLNTQGDNRKDLQWVGSLSYRF